MCVNNSILWFYFTVLLPLRLASSFVIVFFLFVLRLFTSHFPHIHSFLSHSQILVSSIFREKNKSVYYLFIYLFAFVYYSSDWDWDTHNAEFMSSLMMIMIIWRNGRETYDFFLSSFFHPLVKVIYQLNQSFKKLAIYNSNHVLNREHKEAMSVL